MKSFGPVPSRRLGRSLGINNIPPKLCSYSCVYCQLGRTSIKIDAVSETIWRMVARPYRSLKHELILEGLRDFTEMYDGELATETMLIQGVNDGFEETEKLADYISSLEPDKAFIAIPTRPPAENWVKPPEESLINQIFQAFKEKLKHVEYLVGYEGNAFSSTGKIEDDLLNITSVHPMRKEAVNELLNRTGSNWHSIEKLIEDHKLIETEYRGNKFYMRKLVSSYKR